MVNFISIKERQIEYKITRLKKKNISFRFINNILDIRAPLNMSDKDVVNVIKINEERLFKLLIKVESNKKEPLSFEANQKIKVLGKEYLIILAKKRTKDDYCFYVRENNINNDVLNLALIDFDNYISKRTKEYFDSMYSKGDCPKLSYKFVKGYYGKYSKTDHEIIFNISLAFLDKELVDYVIVHELSHIKYLNHQKEFYDFLKMFLPNYKYLEKRLKKEGRVK
ncbi:MAG: DUF45 domain-containing protein [Bacilli bacterium]|nr:DUF45 domain-containing protein [Bacilli bacterium]